MEPAMNNSSNFDFACTINLMTFSKIDELFKTLVLKDLKTKIPLEIPKDKPFRMGSNSNCECQLNSEDISDKHCEIFYCYEDLGFYINNSSKNGTLVYLKNKEFPLEKEMEFKNENGRFSVREFDKEKKILKILQCSNIKEIDLSKNMKIQKSKIYLNNSGKPVLCNTDDDGYS